MRAPTKDNSLALVAVDIGGNNMQGKGQISLSSPHSRSRDQPSIGEHPREAKVDCDSQWGTQCWQLKSKKNIYYHSFLNFSVLGPALLLLLLFFFSSVAEAVDFIIIIIINYLIFWNFTFLTNLFTSSIYCYLYVGLLQFCGVFSFFFFFVFSCYCFPAIVIL